MRIAGRCFVLMSSALVILLAGCTSFGASQNLQHSDLSQGRAEFHSGGVPSTIHEQFVRRVMGQRRKRLAGHFSCPFSGAFEYVSDEMNNVIDVFTGKLAGQAPCGLLASPLLATPSGLYVDPVTHDLYVANWGGSNVLVFHKGATTPYNIYTDPTGQNPYDVALAKDGTVIASNEESIGGKERGSLSTWLSGPSGGTFIKNYPMTNDDFGLFLTLARNGKVYFNDVDSTTGIGALWKVSCPRGACGVQTQVAGVSFADPGGMVFDDVGHLIANDLLRSMVDIFALPNPQPSTFKLPCCPVGVAYDALHQHWFTTSFTYTAEYTYPTFTPIGTVPSQGGAMFGVAVDP